MRVLIRKKKKVSPNPWPKSRCIGPWTTRHQRAESSLFPWRSSKKRKTHLKLERKMNFIVPLILSLFIPHVVARGGQCSGISLSSASASGPLSLFDSVYNFRKKKKSRWWSLTVLQTVDFVDLILCMFVSVYVSFRVWKW